MTRLWDSGLSRHSSSSVNLFLIRMSFLNDNHHVRSSSKSPNSPIFLCSQERTPQKIWSRLVYAGPSTYCYRHVLCSEHRLMLSRLMFQKENMGPFGGSLHHLKLWKSTRQINFSTSYVKHPYNKSKHSFYLPRFSANKRRDAYLISSRDRITLRESRFS